MLSLNNVEVTVSTRYGHRLATRGIDLTIGAGESVGLVGESGSGKSLTCLAIMGLLPSNASVSGAIRFAGQDLLAPQTDMARVRGRHIGMIFQDSIAALNPVRTIGGQLIELIALHRGVSGDAAREIARSLLRDVGISDADERLQSYPHQLSGGMNQRVMIALALAGQPELLIADEPTTALDTTTQAQILDLIRRNQAETGAGLLLVTHDLGVVHETCERIAVMYAGSIVETGRTADVLANSSHPYTRALVAALPSLKSTRQRLEAIPGIVPQLHEMPAGCAFAPRCSRASARCRAERPPRQASASGGAVSCHHPLLSVSTDGPPEEPRPPFTLTQASAEKVIKVERLTCRFNLRRGPFSRRASISAVNDVSLEVSRGETLGLIGESGCGKSTLGRTIMGLNRPQEGSVTVEGRDRRAPNRPATDVMQLVFQDSHGALDPRLRIRDQVEEPLIVQGGHGATERRRRVDQILAAVGIAANQADRFPHQLSGGQRQRVVIARAMVLEPRILVLDEPIASLDLSIQAQVVNLLLDLQVQRGLTYVFISHDLRIVRQVSHRVAVMYLGRIIETGPAASVLDHPEHPYTLMLRSAIPPIGEEEVLEKRLTPIGEPPSLMRQPTGCAFHPRCPLATEICRTSVPVSRARRGQGAVACHHVEALQ